MNKWKLIITVFISGIIFYIIYSGFDYLAGKSFWSQEGLIAAFIFSVLTYFMEIWLHNRKMEKEKKLKKDMNP